MNMKRKVAAILLAALAFSFVAAAQGGVRSANSIKRNPSYIYAEATMGTPQEAFEVASELLYVQAKEYVSEKKSFADKDILLRNIKSQQDSIQMRRGEMYKVFLYIKKSDIIDVDNVTLLNNSGSAQAASSAAAAVEEVTVEIPSVNLEAESVPQPAEIPSDASLKLSSLWQQNLIDDLLDEPSFASAKAKLSRYKSEFKVKNTGPVSTCRNLPAAFLLVGKNGQVVTVLGPDEAGRTDFKALNKTSLDRYQDAELVWFTLAK